MKLRNFSFKEAEDFLNGFTNYEKYSALKLRRADSLRMSAFLKLLGNPQRSVRSVHVTGSKGKGSFCILLESILKMQGFTVGTYLSPHLECVTERIRLGGKQLSKRHFSKALFGLRKAIETLSSPPTYFEILTALSWCVYREAKVDVAVIEAGIGGRHDATGFLDPALTVVTSVEKEHTALLGRTEAEILLKKIGIARLGIPLLVGPLKPGLRSLIVKEAARSHVRLVFWNDSVRFRYNSGKVYARLLSCSRARSIKFQAPDRPFGVNAVLAVMAAELLAQENGWSVSGEKPAGMDTENATENAIEKVRIPGRKELFPGSPDVLIDVAHTYQSLKTLKNLLHDRFSEKCTVVVFGISKDKEIKRLLSLVESFADSIIFICADSLRGKSAEELLKISTHKKKKCARDIESAMRCAVKDAGDDGLVCVCGSFFVAGKARKSLRYLNFER